MGHAMHQQHPRSHDTQAESSVQRLLICLASLPGRTKRGHNPCRAQLRTALRVGPYSVTAVDFSDTAPLAEQVAKIYQKSTARLTVASRSLSFLCASPKVVLKLSVEASPLHSVFGMALFNAADKANWFC